MQSSIQYTNSALVITIPCANPAAVHLQLMKSITANVKYSSACQNKSIEYTDEILPLLSLLATMIPGERELEKAYDH